MSLDLNIVISFGIMMITIIGANVTLYIHSNTTTNKQIEAIRLDVKAIQDEMKDFHGKLERQDAEFKSALLRICTIEEKGKKQLLN